MVYFENNRLVDFEDLKQVVDEKGKRIYSENLIQQLEGGNLNALHTINVSDRNNRYFMEPLLFAVKNSEFSTYEVYKYYGEELQKSDLTIATEIVMNEPEVLEDTSITDNSNLVLHFAKINPEIILYISEDLKNDGEFIEELCEIGNKEAIMYAVRECNVSTVLQDNPELASNSVFMKEAIKEDATLIAKVPDELKNNSDFIRETSKENYKVVGYIINNKDEFGLEAIKGAKDTTREVTTEHSMQIINKEAINSDDIRYKKVSEKVKEVGKDDVHTVRWVTAMAAQSDKVTPEYFRKVFDDSTLAMLEIKKDLTLDGKEKVSIENMQKMVTPQILNKLKEKAVEQGLEVDEDLENKLKEYTEFFYNYRTKLQEVKKQNIQKNNIRITPEQIEEKTDNTRISEINGETQWIRKEYIRQAEEKEVGREDESIGDESRA